MDSSDHGTAVAERLRSLRIASGMTQTQAAEALKVRQPTISRFEVGARRPSEVWLRAFATLYGVPLSDLTGAPPQGVGQ